MENPDNEDIIIRYILLIAAGIQQYRGNLFIQMEETLCLFLWPNNIITFFPSPAMFYLPCVDHVILFVDDVVNSWPQTKISDWSEIKCIVNLPMLYRIEHILSQSVYHTTSKSCMIQSNSTVYTLFFGLWWYLLYVTGT